MEVCGMKEAASFMWTPTHPPTSCQVRLDLAHRNAITPLKTQCTHKTIRNIYENPADSRKTKKQGATQHSLQQKHVLCYLDSYLSRS